MFFWLLIRNSVYEYVDNLCECNITQFCMQGITVLIKYDKSGHRTETISILVKKYIIYDVSIGQHNPLLLFWTCLLHLIQLLVMYFSQSWKHLHFTRQSSWKVSIFIHDNLFDVLSLLSSISQGSVLGPLFFTFYIHPFGIIMPWYGIRYHLYASGTQL